DVALASVDRQLRDVEQGDTLLPLRQVVPKAPRELRRLRDVPRVFSKAGAGREQQDVVFLPEMPNEPRARIDQTPPRAAPFPLRAFLKERLPPSPVPSRFPPSSSSGGRYPPYPSTRPCCRARPT